MNTYSRFIVAAVACALGACATCREHPVACTVVGTVLIAGAVVALDHHHHDGNAPANCTRGISLTSPLRCSP